MNIFGSGRMIYSAVGLLSYRPVDGQSGIDHENGKAAKGHSYSTILPVGNRNATLFALNLVDRAQKHFLDPCLSQLVRLIGNMCQSCYLRRPIRVYSWKMME